MSRQHKHVQQNTFQKEACTVENILFKKIIEKYIYFEQFQNDNLLTVRNMMVNKIIDKKVQYCRSDHA